MSSEKGRMFSHLKWKDRLKIEKMLKEKKSKIGDSAYSPGGLYNDNAGNQEGADRTAGH